MSKSTVGDALRRVWETTRRLLTALAVFVLNLIAALIGFAAVAVEALARFVGALARLLIVVGLVAVVAWAWPATWLAFGGDAAAMIPSTLLCAGPVAWSLTHRRGWGGLVAAAGVTLLGSIVLSAVTRLVAHLLLLALLVAIVVQSIQNGAKHGHRGSNAEPKQ